MNLTSIPILLLSLPASGAILSSFEFTGGSGTSSDTSIYSTTSTYDARSAAIAAADDPGTAYDDDSALSSFSNAAFHRAENTPNSSSPVSSIFYHTFSLTVANLGTGKTLNLTSLDFDYFATNVSGVFFVGAYSDAVGYTGTSDKLGTTNINTNAGASFSLDLTSTNTVAGSSFTGLTNGETLEFRFYFGDASTSNNSIHRLDNIVLNGDVVPEPSTSLLGILGFLILLHRRR